eukprot:Hpha_TRINITY_DN15416_c1_g7::TRINITY_DN15416_c1_g7_i1::g.176975::m.176975
MMRRGAQAGVQAGRRCISGVAPVLHFPKTVAGSKEEQVAKNTAAALDFTRAQLGEKPAPYTRKYTHGIAEIQKEVEDTLKSTGASAPPLQAGAELKTSDVVERVLRHGVLSYLKNEGTYDWEGLEKWLVYTPTDAQEFSKLKREVEDKIKYAEYKKDHSAPLVPEFDWAAEYAEAIDREVVSEKRNRYDKIASQTFERDESAIEAELAAYRRPKQDKLLDSLVDQLTQFKPFLARQVIQAKLIERNAENQLSFARFADWNPDARDIAEAEHEAQPSGVATGEGYGVEESYKRYAEVRMRTTEEVLDRMDRTQAERAADSSSGGGSAVETKRAALMAEIIKLQTRGAREEEDTKADDDDAEDAEAKEAAAAAAKAAKEKEMERYQVDPNKIKQKGLIGLTFLDADASA